VCWTILTALATILERETTLRTGFTPHSGAVFKRQNRKQDRSGKENS
jgi:hypothetical protein